MKNNKLTVILLIIIGAILGSLITFGFVAWFNFFTDSPYLLNSTVSKLSRVDYISINHLLDKNVIFSADDLLGQIGTVYSTIIMTLIALITVMTLFTLFFVKSSVEEKATFLAKATAKEVINDKISPKIEQINLSLQKFDEQALATKLDILLQTKVMDSLTFWSKVEESIYAKAEEALQDYDFEQMNNALNKTTDDINSITENIQTIHQSIEKLQEKPIDDKDNIIDLGNGK